MQFSRTFDVLSFVGLYRPPVGLAIVLEGLPSHYPSTSMIICLQDKLRLGTPST